jgi:hypothetical protein
MESTYSIYRKFFNDDIDTEFLVGGLSLEDARAHCRDPETSSRTCKEPENVARTEEYGPWFECYDED